MKVVNWTQFLENDLPPQGKLSSMTVGVFDGVHRGHQSLIERIVSRSSNAPSADYVPTVVTFRQNHKTSPDIQTFEQRLEIFESLGIEITVVIDFTESFMQLPGLEFLNLLLKHGRIGFFAAGDNFRCGCKLDTDAKAIKDFFASHNIPAEIVPQIMEGALPISSSRIRAAIASGDHALAEKMLGRRSK